VGLRGRLRRTWGRISQSRALARRLFGIDFTPRDDPGARYFDLTTPVIVSVVAPCLRPGMRLLDMGTGAFATIGLALWRRTGCDVVATDVRRDLVQKAQASADANRASIRVVQARYFDGVDGEFDCVTFNVPYVPSSLLPGPDVQSDGGPEGTSVIEGFLDAFAAKGGRATAFLGVNRLFVSRETVVPLLDRRPGVRLIDIRRRWPWPVDVYVLARSG
jgi:methylase of polypeptide subunit release factors